MKTNIYKALTLLVAISSMTISLPLFFNAGAYINQDFATDADLDGFLTHKIAGPYWVDNSSDIRVGTNWTSGILSLHTERGFLSFDTSAIAQSDIILEANLYIYHNSTTITGDAQGVANGNISICVLTANYGASLDANSGDWNSWVAYSPGTNGIIYNSTIDDSQGWRQTTISPDNIFAGTTQFALLCDQETTVTAGAGERYALFDSADQANAPYLYVKAISGNNATVEYIFTAPGMTNRTLNSFPSSTTPQGYYKNVLEYIVYSYNQSYIHFSVPDNTTYISVMPYANVTLISGNTYNITETENTIYYRLFFFKEVDQTDTIVYISLFDQQKGKGIAPWEWNMYISEGQSFESTNAEKIPGDVYRATLGKNYTIAIKDFFNQTLTTYSFAANAPNLYIEIPIPYYSLKFFNQQSDFVEIWWYFSGNLSTDPYNEFLAPGEAKFYETRQGNYTFKIIHYTTADNLSFSQTNTYWYNFTIDGAYYINIKGDSIITVISRVTGIEQDIDVVIAYASPYALYVPINMPLAPTQIRTFDNLGLNDLLPFYGQGTRGMDEYAHTYAIYEADISEAYSGTTANLLDPKPTGGNVTVVSDTLTISSEFNTRIFLNYTNGTNYANYTTNPGKVILHGYNLTLWANNTLNAVREVTLNVAGIFTWSITDNEFSTYLALNNTSIFDYTNIYWYVPFAYKTDIDINETWIRDLDNSDLFLVNGQHFAISLSGMHFDFSSLDSGEKRNFEIRYETKNETPTANSPITKTVREWNYIEKNGEQYIIATVTVNNPYRTSYEGDIWIKLDFDQAAYMDASTLNVKKINPEAAISDDDIIPQGIVVVIKADSVGSMGVGGAIEYEITFKTKNEPGYGEKNIWSKIFTFAGIPFSILSLILMGLFASMMVIPYVRRDQDRMMYMMLAATAFFAYIVMTIIAAAGV